MAAANEILKIAFVEDRPLHYWKPKQFHPPNSKAHGQFDFSQKRISKQWKKMDAKKKNADEIHSHHCISDKTQPASNIIPHLNSLSLVDNLPIKASHWTKDPRGTLWPNQISLYQDLTEWTLRFLLGPRSDRLTINQRSVGTFWWNPTDRLLVGC